jgi:DNA topoisomerase-1
VRHSDPLTIDLPTALTLIANREEQKKKAQEALRELGKDPNSGGDIKLKTGRFGPYVTDGTTNASLGKKFDPDTITPEEAAELLKKKREAGPSKWKGRWAKKK